MKEEKKEAPIGVLWGWGKPYHGKFIGSVILAVLGVACQMVPYFCVAHIVTMMLSGEQNFSRYVTAGIIALCGYFGKVLFSCLSTTISHTATYYTLRDLRENITAKLVRIPMGTILDTPSGQYKTTIVDRVEGMEPTFAHLIPEMTANVLVPIVIAVYLFLLDWRMALLSLVTLVVGLAVMSAGMKNYPVKWEGAVKAGKLMANAIVEYIGGIEVVKAFSQSAGSYKKYSDAVNYNANYYVDWMHENQKTMSAYNAILPSVLICVLPCGFAFWLSGSLELSTFLSIVIFSLGLIGPIIAAFTFTDDLAVLGTNVEEISQLLPLEEQLEKLIALFYGDWGFKASRGVYRLSDALWLDQVLKNRQGSAVSLGAVLLWVANRLDLPLLPVIFPTQLILRIECPDGEIWLINPFNGESLSEHMLDVWLKGNISPSAELFYEDLDEADNIEVIRKLLDTLKASLMEENQMELALRTSEALLQFNPEDPYEIRDRGLIYAQLDCEHVALNDLSYFVEQCPEDPISEMIRAQINNIAHKHIVLH